MNTPEISREEFAARFLAHMIARVGPNFRFDPDDGEAQGPTIQEYVADTWETYWEEPDQRADGPEECAEADMSYWGE